jgi:hypothetical protein
LPSNLAAYKIWEFLEQHTGGFSNLHFCSIWKILNQLLTGWGHYSVSVKATRVTPLSNTDPRAHMSATRGRGTCCLSAGLAHRRLADDWLDHLSIPLAGLTLIPSHSFCPKFRDQRARAPASTALSTIDLRSMSVSSCACVSHHR